MAIRGQRFELDLDTPDFAIKPLEEADQDVDHGINFVKEIQEHESTAIPSAPQLKPTKSGFPEHRPRRNVSAFKQGRAYGNSTSNSPLKSSFEPSDRAIANQLAKKHGVDLEAQQKAEISEENKKKIAGMSTSEIEEARAELLSQLNPTFIERLMKRANIDEVPADSEYTGTGEQTSSQAVQSTADRAIDTTTIQSQVADIEEEHSQPTAPSIHFPVPMRDTKDFVPLDPSSSTFLSDLKTHYFPDTPHDPSQLSWLQDPSSDEFEDSAYRPEKDSYTASSLRFGFTGRLIPPKESLEIDIKEGLHHHGDAPSSAGYTVPEMALLARSTMPNQRSVAYQVLGRLLYRLGRDEFGPRGSELQEALWNVVEKERVIEIMMAEANREKGHVSARAYAIEALWLWRKGNGGDRGLLKPSEKVAK